MWTICRTGTSCVLSCKFPKRKREREREREHTAIAINSSNKAFKFRSGCWHASARQASELVNHTKCNKDHLFWSMTNIPIVHREKSLKLYTHWVGPSHGACSGLSCTCNFISCTILFVTWVTQGMCKNIISSTVLNQRQELQGRLTSMKSPSTPTATQALAMQGISSRRPPLATPPPSSCPHSAVRKMNSCVDKPFLL